MYELGFGLTDSVVLLANMIAEGNLSSQMDHHTPLITCYETEDIGIFVATVQVTQVL